MNEVVFKFKGGKIYVRKIKALVRIEVELRCEVGVASVTFHLRKDDFEELVQFLKRIVEVEENIHVFVERNKKEGDF